MLKVFKTRCDQCLFSKNRIVSNQRAAEIIKDCLKKQTYFICHKATIEGESVMCRGFYDEMGYHSQQLRIAERLNAVEFVEQKNKVCK